MSAVIEVTRYEDDNSVIVNVFGSDSGSLRLSRQGARVLGAMLEIVAEEQAPMNAKVTWEEDWREGEVEQEKKT